MNEPMAGSPADSIGESRMACNLYQEKWRNVDATDYSEFDNQVLEALHNRREGSRHVYGSGR